MKTNSFTAALFFLYFCLCGQLFETTSATRKPDGLRKLLRQVVRRENDLYAPQDRYPYVVSLQHPNTGQHICMGTLLHESWILTNARCIDTKRFTTAVRNPIAALGSETITGPFKEKHLIKMAFVHPLYNGLEIGPYDIALLKLSKPSRIQPLVTLHLDTPPLIEGLETRALSWSRLEPGGPYSKQLLEIRGMHLMNPKSCSKKYGYSEKNSCLKVSRGVVCAGGAGGPIIVPSFPDILIGMAIENKDCSSDEKTTGYIPIEPSKKWIWNLIAQLET